MKTYILRIEKDHEDSEQDVKIEFEAANNEDACDIAEAKAVEALPDGWTAWCVLMVAPSFEIVTEFEAN